MKLSSLVVLLCVVCGVRSSTNIDSIVSSACQDANVVRFQRDSNCTDWLFQNIAACPFPAIPEMLASASAAKLWPCVRGECVYDPVSSACIGITQQYCAPFNWSRDSGCSNISVPCDVFFNSTRADSPCRNASCINGTTRECSAAISAFCVRPENEMESGCAPPSIVQLSPLQVLSAGACPFPYPAGDSNLSGIWPCANPECISDLTSPGCLFSIVLYCGELEDWTANPGCTQNMKVHCPFVQPSYPSKSSIIFPKFPCNATECTSHNASAMKCKAVVDEYCLFFGHLDKSCAVVYNVSDTLCPFENPNLYSLSQWPCVSTECTYLTSSSSNSGSTLVTASSSLQSAQCVHVVAAYCADAIQYDSGCAKMQIQCPFNDYTSTDYPCTHTDCLSGNVSACSQVVNSHCSSHVYDSGCAVNPAIASSSIANCIFYPGDEIYGSYISPCYVDVCARDITNSSCSAHIASYCSEGSASLQIYRWKDTPACASRTSPALGVPCSFGSNVCDRSSSLGIACDVRSRLASPEACNAVIASYCEAVNNIDNPACGCIGGMFIRLTVTRGEIPFSTFSALSLNATLSRKWTVDELATDQNLLWPGYSWKLPGSSPMFCMQPSATFQISVDAGYQPDRLSLRANDENGNFVKFFNESGIIFNATRVGVGSGGVVEFSIIPFANSFALSVTNHVFPTASPSSTASVSASRTPSPSASVSLTPVARCQGLHTPCLNAGYCVQTRSSINCICQSDSNDVPYYLGTMCEQKNPCNPNPCSNNGTCSISSLDWSKFECSCQQGYSGNRCDHVNVCELSNSNPCNHVSNTSTCIPTQDNSFHCVCDPQYTGQHCDKKILPSVKLSMGLSGIVAVQFSSEHKRILANLLTEFLGANVSSSNIRTDSGASNSKKAQQRKQTFDVTVVIVVNTTDAPSAIFTVLYNSTFLETLRNTTTFQNVSTSLLSAVSQFLDCTGIIDGRYDVDVCGVCNGTGGCVDCLGIPFGVGRVDVCGVCNGNSDTCWDCLGIPNGGNVLDVCGRCGEDGSSCAVTATPTPTPESHSSSISSGTIAGAVIGSILGAIVFVAAIAVFWNRRRQRKHVHLEESHKIGTDKMESNDGSFKKPKL